MKKIFLSLFAVAIVSANVWAQQPQEKRAPKKTPEERTEKIMDKLNVSLGLSDAQKAKVKEIVLKREQDRDAARAQFVSNREALMKANKETAKAAEEQLKTVLNADQMKKLKEEREEMKKKRREKMAPPPPQNNGSNTPPPPPPPAPQH